MVLNRDFQTSRPRRLLTRREGLRLGAGALAGAALLPAFAAAQSGAWQRLDEARAVIGDAEPVASGLDLDLPLLSENGATVPLTVSVPAPMTDADYVESVHLFAPRNPTPELAVFRFTPLAGRAEIQTRVRLNESQAVVAVARLSSGEIRVTEREVRVTVTGCLLSDDTYSATDLMQTRIRVPERLAAGEAAEVLTLINHPMETGLRTDSSGATLPQRIIERFEARLDDAPAVTAELHRGISANPYLRFYLAPRASGQLTLEWVEDTGERVVETARITVA